MDLIRSNQEYRNFVSIYSGLALVGEKLQGYTDSKLDETYKVIYKQLAGKPPCLQQCSKIYKNRTAQWCDTCESWRKELCKTRSSKHNITWGNMNSSDWPTCYRNIAEVYLPNGWTIRDFKDVSTACHIWMNLQSCTINKWTIKRLKDVRNNKYAHNSEQRATDREKLLAFDAFKDILKDGDVQAHIDSSECIEELNKIKDANDRQLRNIEHCLTEIRRGQLANNNPPRDDTILMSVLNRAFAGLSFTWTTFEKYYILMVLVLIGLLSSVMLPFYEIHQKVGCLSEDFVHPFEQDMPLLGYLNEHKALVGREWLFDEIRESILKNSSDNRKSIIALVADMGYGKSALVSHMLCPDRYSQANVIRKHIVGFHVCKFDVRSTHAPERFIRRLVGFLARRSPEYGNKISMLPKSSILYNAEECSRDYVACFDQGVSIPLNEIEDIGNAPWVIVIDALDECESFDKNDILQLLLSRSMHIPKFLKFLVTSRNTTSLMHLKRLEMYYLLANDARNIKDITDYIQQHLRKSAFNQDLVNDLVNYSDGNFVYVVQAVKWLIANSNTGQIPTLPVDLEDVYEINFDRIYTNIESYTIPRMILEIICSAANPMGKPYIYQILASSNVTLNTDEFDKHFHSLSFFLNVDKNVRLAHQALFHWLVSERNLNYRISLERGHSLTSQYLLSMTSKLSHNDLVDLVIHVSYSEDYTLAELFESSNFNNNIFEGKSLLHKIIWQTSDVNPLKLLLKHTSILDSFNEGGVTPVFVAASKGHVDQLELLHKMGANINFQVKSEFRIQENEAEFKITSIKQVYFSGYTLLHIASQHGHIDIVKYLIKQNRNLVFVRNALGLQPGLVACENGHLTIIHELFDMYPKSFGRDCLYYSSKNNHLHIVKWLVSKGVRFMCISDNLALSALKVITKDKRKDLFQLKWVMFPSESFLPYLIHPLDKWWQVYKFDPLLAGIRQGSIQTAQYLIKTFPNSLECADSFGFTAALASVAFNRSELLPFVTSNLITDKCQAVPFYLRKSSLTYIRGMLDRNNCPEGAGLGHVVALCNLPNMLTYIVQHDLVRDWNEADKDGFLPVHYAAEKINFIVLKHYKYLGFSYEDAKAGDGSTIYHISARNGILASTCTRDDTILNRIPDGRDNQNMSTLHYVVSYVDNARTADMFYSLHVALKVLFQHLIQIQKHDLMARTNLQRNILHYALQNGYFEIIHYLYSAQRSAVKTMLLQIDIFGHRPVGLALEMYTQDIYFLIEPYDVTNCFYFELFYTQCITDWEQYATFMSAWELSLLHVIEQMTKSEFKELLEPHLSHIWSKSVYLFVVVINNHLEYLDMQLMRNLLLRHSDSLLVRYNQLTLARFVPSVFRYCKSKTMAINSPLLYIVRNFNYQNTLFSLTNDYVSIAYGKVFRSPKHSGHLHCNDKHGYNIVYHAVKAGNIQIARSLISYGIKITSPSIDVKGIFLAALTAKRRTHDANFFGCSMQYNSQAGCTDVFLTEVLKLSEKTLMSTDFCKNGTSGLSLVHILSANGMLQTLKRLVKMFSWDILACYNADRLTPLYLAQTFNKNAVVSFLSSKLAMSLPDNYAEEFLIVSLLCDFPFRNYSSCITLHGPDRRLFGSWYSCIYVILRQLSQSKQQFLQRSSDILQRVGVNLYELKTCTDYFGLYASFNSIPKCEKFVRMCFRCYDKIVRLQSSFREFFVLKTIGQFPGIVKLSKLERLIEVSMKRMISVAENKFCMRYQKWTFEAFHSSVYYTLSEAHTLTRELVITYFLQFNKNNITNVPYEYQFMRSRLAVYRLTGSDTNTLPAHHNFILNTHRLHYLNILMKTLSYKELHDVLGKHTTAVAVYEKQPQSVELERVNIEDPFVDLH